MRIVVKVGTSLLTDKHHQLDVSFLQQFVAQIAHLHREGHQIVIVTSGAVAAGRGELTFKHEKKNIPFRQALAAVGQGKLMQTYHDLFQKYGIHSAQALLTNYDFVNRENFLNTKNVFEVLLQHLVIPIVNENDVTTIAELKFMDNDMLSAKTAAMVSADYLFILTDVDGLFAQDPKKNPHAKLIPVVEKVDDSIRSLAKGARSKHSMGGMISKLDAADYVTSVGIPMVIANGGNKDVLMKLAKDVKEAGTYFIARVKPAESQKKWLKPQIKKQAWIEIDEGACAALLQMGKSLLPSGVTKVHGVFSRGDVLKVKASEREIAYGQVNYGSADLDKIKKHKSSEIEDILGFSFEDEVIHRDRMVIV